MTRKLFALYAAAFVLIAGGISDAAPVSDAAGIVNAFYRWYFAGHGNWTNLAGARQYLTPSLYATLAKVVATQQQAHAEVLDFDPFTGAQERALSYATGNASAKGSHVSVPVSLRYGGGTGAITAILVDTSGQWKIDDFIYPGIGTLRRSVQEALR